MSASVVSFPCGLRSLSGRSLNGDRIMRLVYMDEAGISNPEHEPCVVVSAVIVDADKQPVALQRELDRVIQRHIPEDHQAGFVFHATELFNGGGKVFKRNDPDWPLDKRLKIADDLAAIPKKLGLPLTFGHVERKNFPSAIDGSSMDIKEKTKGAHYCAFMACVLGVEMWMRKTLPNEVCFLIPEETNLKSLLTEAVNIYQDKGKITQLLGEIDAKRSEYYPLRKVAESPLFQTKSQSKALQMADFTAYVVKKRAMNNPRYDRFFFAFSDSIVWVDPNEAR